MDFHGSSRASINPKRTGKRPSFGMPPHIRHASSKEECLSLLGSNAEKLVVFIFVADWCPHSAELRHHLSALAKDEHNVLIVLIDVDEAEARLFCTVKCL
ncbi:hypothetical protein SprV_0501938100 [Sparganum proliferum]